MSKSLSHGIEIEVTPHFHPDRSAPSQHRWFFSYDIRITNTSQQTVQLLRRHWVITNGRGEVEHVRGVGVVGEQPVLLPTRSFRYTSFCPLDTSLGAMHGSFQFRSEDGSTFEAEIAPFTLADPADLN